MNPFKIRGQTKDSSTATTNTVFCPQLCPKLGQLSSSSIQLQVVHLVHILVEREH